MAEIPPAEVRLYCGFPTILRPGEGDESWIVLGPNRTAPDVRQARPDLAVIQVRRIGWLTPDGTVWAGDVPPRYAEAEKVPIFVPLSRDGQPHG